MKLSDISKKEKPKLIEAARGIPFRQPEQDIFVNSQGHELTYIGYYVFPSPSGQFETMEHMLDTITTWQSEERVDQIQWANASNAGTKGAMVVKLVDSNNKPYYFGRYFKKIPKDLAGLWVNTKFTQDFGYKVKTQVSEMEAIPLKPSDFMPSGGYFESVEELAVYIKGKSLEILAEEYPDVVPMVEQFIDIILEDREEIYVPGARKYKEAFEKYAAEWLGPMAMVRRWNVTGDFDEAEQNLVVPFNSSFETLKLRFPASSSNALVDSEFVSKNVADPPIYVGVSSKTARSGGAAASLAGIYQVINRGLDEDFAAKYSTEIDIIKEIVENSAIIGPLEVAMTLKLINEEEARFVKDLVINKITPGEFASLDILHAHGINVIKSKTLENMRSRYAADSTKANYMPGYHYLASIARAVGDKVNSNRRFNEVIKGILEKSSMVQLYASVSLKGDAMAFTNFKVTYPATFSGTIILDAAKPYYASGINGKLTFKFK